MVDSVTMMTLVLVFHPAFQCWLVGSFIDSAVKG